MDNENMIKEHIAKITSKNSSLNEKFEKHTKKIEKLHQDYQKIKKDADKIETIIKRYIERDDEEKGKFQRVLLRQQFIKEEEEKKKIQKYLSKLKNWAIKAFEEIVKIRTLITGGQKLTYHILDENKNSIVSYELNEDQFIKLLKGSKGLKTYKQNIKNLKDGALSSVLGLSVDKLTKNKRKKLKIVEGTELTNDPLFNYLQSINLVRDKEGSEVPLHMSRLYELYDQTKASVFNNSDPIGELSKKQQEVVRRFATRYVGANFHIDKIPFYKTGDAVLDSLNLIENKIGGSAVINIGTIINAIEGSSKASGLYEILCLEGNSKGKLAEKLKELYTYSENNDLGKEVQEGAKNYAQDAIDDFVKKIGLTK